jgi:hypothetical protein
VVGRTAPPAAHCVDKHSCCCVRVHALRVYMPCGHSPAVGCVSVHRAWDITQLLRPLAPRRPRVTPHHPSPYIHTHPTRTTHLRAYAVRARVVCGHRRAAVATTRPPAPRARAYRARDRMRFRMSGRHENAYGWCEEFHRCRSEGVHCHVPPVGQTVRLSSSVLVADARPPTTAPAS